MITGQKSRAEGPPVIKKGQKKGFIKEGKKRLPVQINKITPRFFYTHPIAPPDTHTPTHREYLGSASLVAWQQLMGKKSGGAPMIKISWVAVFDPQYAVIVSPQLHKKASAGVARERGKRIHKLSHSCQEVAGFAH